MIRISGSDLGPVYEEERKGDIKFNEVDATKSKKIFWVLSHLQIWNQN
jgi:hypothetical protein